MKIFRFVSVVTGGFGMVTVIALLTFSGGASWVGLVVSCLSALILFSVACITWSKDSPSGIQLDNMKSLIIFCFALLIFLLSLVTVGSVLRLLDPDRFSGDEQVLVTLLFAALTGYVGFSMRETQDSK